MGTQCSNLYDQLSANTKPRDRLIQTSVSNVGGDLHHHHQQYNTLYRNDPIDLKIQFIAEIQNQLIQQGQPHILTFKKHTQNKYHVKFIDGSQYHGNLSQNGKRIQEGQQMWKDGTKIITTWLQNLPHGPGILISPNGFTFQGFWNQGIVQGYGKYYGKNGSYEGEWRDNQPHGYGIQTWSDGSIFQGNYHQGLKHGIGKYTWPDKSTYKGNWQHGQINGQGIYHYIDGRIYEGQFKNNKMQGKGIYTWPDGRKYIGCYENDKKHGLGRYYWSDGKYFEGEWKHGKRDGYGQLVYPNGVVKQGVWQNDHKLQYDPHHRSYQAMNSHIRRIRSTVDQSQSNPNSHIIIDRISTLSPTFNQLKSVSTTYDYNDNKNIFSSSSPTKSQYKKITRLPRTEHKPLYASSHSPYKQLRTYYEEMNDNNKEVNNRRLMNRYSFINNGEIKVSNKKGKKGGYLSKLKPRNERKSKFFNHNSLEK